MAGKSTLKRLEWAVAVVAAVGQRLGGDPEFGSTAIYPTRVIGAGNRPAAL